MLEVKQETKQSEEDNVESSVTFPPRVKPVHASRESQRGRTSQDDSSISGVAWLHRNSTAAGGRTSIDLHAYENMLRSVTKQDGDGAESRTSLDYNFKHGERRRKPSADLEQHDYLTEHVETAAVEVIRARIVENSALIGTTPSECKFDTSSKASIMAVQRVESGCERRLQFAARPSWEISLRRQRYFDVARVARESSPHAEARARSSDG